MLTAFEQGLAPRKVSGLRTAPSFEVASSLLPLIDLLIFLACSLAGALSYEWLYGEAPAAPSAVLGVGTIAGCVYVVRMHSIRCYDIRLCLLARLETGHILRSWGTSAFVLTLLALMFKFSLFHSHLPVIAFVLLSLVVLIAWRAAVKYLLWQAIKNGVVGHRRVVVIGERNELASLGVEQLLLFFGVVDAKRFTLSNYGDRGPISADDAGILKSAIDFVKENDLDEVLLALPWGDIAALQPVREQLRVLPVPIRLLPDRSVRSTISYPSVASALPLTFLVDLQAAPLNYTERFFKRLMDIALASIALMLLLPIMIFAAIAIKLDSPGPLMFRQRRNGFNGKPFIIYKFRTMTVQEDGATVTQASRHDPRVTRIGRLFRTASIDELPQLLNVLLGDMSLVGPRPHAVSHDLQFQKVVADYAVRHHMKPGITGWAQCHGLRGATPSLRDMERRVEFDLWYINNWSPWLDIRILTMTAFEILRWDRAY